MPYRISYTNQARDDLRYLTANQQSRITDEVLKQLPYQPTIRTINRKPMEPNPLGVSWVLRVGNLRVYYDVENDPPPTIFVRRVGIKKGNRVHIGNEWLEPRTGRE